MAKRNKSGQFVKGKGSGKSKPTSGSKKKGKAKGKGLAKSGAVGADLALKSTFMLKKPAAGDSMAVAVKKLQHNQQLMVAGLGELAREVVVHRRALVGAGLIAMRGGAQ